MENKLLSLSLSDYVRVKILPAGMKIIASMNSADIEFYGFNNIDSDGYCWIQLINLCYVFGPFLDFRNLDWPIDIDMQINKKLE